MIDTKRAELCRAMPPIRVVRDNTQLACTHLGARLNAYVALGSIERHALYQAVGASQAVPAREEFGVFRPGVIALQFIQNGYACQYIRLPDGREQILRVLMPGDICHQTNTWGYASESRICALSKVSYGLIFQKRFEGLTIEHARLGRAFARSAVVDQAILHERVVSLAQRSARERLGHFLCESFLRSKLIGTNVGMQCNFPLNQGDLSKLLGLSLVHTNRSLQAIRAEGLVSLDGGVLTILDLARLKTVAMSDFSYLQ